MVHGFENMVEENRRDVALAFRKVAIAGWRLNRLRYFPGGGDRSKVTNREWGVTEREGIDGIVKVTWTDDFKRNVTGTGSSPGLKEW